MEHAVATDPAVAARLAEFRSQSERLRRAYAPVLEEPVPERLRAVFQRAAPPAGGTVVNLAAQRAARVVTERLRGWAWPEWTAMAASLLVGVFAMQIQTHRSDDAPIRTRPDGLVAGSALAKALSTQLASTQGRDSAIQVGLSFENRDGQMCRTFNVPGARAWSGLACFSGGDWHVGMAIEDPRSAQQRSPDAMRMAASEIPPEILRAATEQMRAEPMDAAAERAARDRGWRP